MNNITLQVIGYIAASFSTFAMLPQALHVYKTNEVERLSLRTFTMATIGAVLWLVYGILKNDMVIILANAFGVVIVGYIFTKKYTHHRKKHDSTF